MYLYLKNKNSDKDEYIKGKIIDYNSILGKDDYKIEINFDNSQTKVYYLKIALEKNSLLIRQNEKNDPTEIKKTIEYFHEHGIPENLDFLYNKLLNTLLGFGFIGFVHGTPLKTIPEILKSRFVYSRDYLIRNNKKFTDAANQEALAITHEKVKKKTRFYFYPKTPTLYRMCQEHKMCLLIFKWDLVETYESFFSDGNMAVWKKGDLENEIKVYKAIEVADNTNLICWQKVFERGPHSKDSKITRIRNAEMLSEEKISLKYLDKIIFKTNEEKEHCISLLSNECYEKYEKYFIVDNSKFN